MGNEFFYTDKNGNKQDADLHNEILTNPEADTRIAEIAIKRALASGINVEMAQRLYVLRPYDLKP